MKKVSFLSLLLLLVIVKTWSQGIALQLSKPGDPETKKFSADRLQRIDKLVKQYVDSGWVKGATALIARDGKIVYYNGFGYADAEQNRKMTTDAIFRIASQTKAVTSVAVMMLFEEGKFLLDDPISKYIPAFAHPKVLAEFNPKDSSYTTINATREITIRDLLTHTSGIDYAEIGSANMKAIYAKAGVHAGLVSDKILLADAMNKLGTLPLLHEPGLRFTYGLNIDVLGYLVEKLSGESLDRFFKEMIFDPLGMKDTYFYLPQNKQDRLVSAYAPDKNQHLVKWPTQAVPGISADYPTVNGTYYSGGAGLSSTIMDYATFLQMLLNKGEYNGQRLLSRHTVDLMTSNQIGDLMVNNINKFGLGFEITTEKGQSVLGQTEGSFSWGGAFGTNYWADPKEHLVCLIFTQEWPFPHNELLNKFKALVYGALNY